MPAWSIFVYEILPLRCTAAEWFRLSLEQVSDPILKGVAGQEPGVEQAQLGTSGEHDFGTPTADPLGALGAKWPPNARSGDHAPGTV